MERSPGVASLPVYVRLLRPGNLLLTALAVLLGAALAMLEGGSREPGPPLLAALAAVLIAAGAYALNDAEDRTEDAVNRPGRPVPSGLLPEAWARGTGVVLMLLGVALSLAGGLALAAFAAGAALLLAAYALFLKGLGAPGNLAVAVCAAASFLFGALAAGNLQAGWTPALLAGPIHLAREWIKDVEDVAGDRAAGRRTLAASAGPGWTLRAAALVMILTAMGLPVPYFTGWAGWPYLAVSLPLVGLPLAYWAGGALAWPGRVNPGRLQRGLKWIMVPGMLAVGLGAWLR